MPRNRVEGRSAAYEYRLSAQQEEERRQLLELRLLVAKEIVERRLDKLKRGDVPAAEAALVEIASFLRDSSSG
jgi:hypothetical protein